MVNKLPYEKARPRQRPKINLRTKPDIQKDQKLLTHTYYYRQLRWID